MFGFGASFGTNRTHGRNRAKPRDLVEPTIHDHEHNELHTVLVRKPPYPSNTNFVTGSPCCLALCRLRPQLGLDPSPLADADVVKNYWDLGGNAFTKDYVGAHATSTTVSLCPYHL
jgi:hypothetical protein